MALKVINQPGTVLDKPHKKTKRVIVAKPAKKRSPYSGVYPSYLFIDHDPVLDQIDTLISDSDMTLEQVSEQSHVSLSALVNWRKRKTKRPQFATIAAVVKSMGGDVVIVNRFNAKIVRPDSTRKADT